MYYYIFEPAHTAKELEYAAQIKDYLSKNGIAGEITAPTSQRSIEDLVELAVGKRYSTVVAVGNGAHINRVAASLYEYDVVFGIIPFAPQQELTQLIGYAEWQESAEHLKRRLWQPVQLGIINGQEAFLTPATVVAPASVAFEVELPSYACTVTDKSLAVTPQSEKALVLQSGSEEPAKKGLFSFFSAKKKAPTATKLPGEWINVRQPAELPIVVAGQPLTQTPALFSMQDKPVKLIMAKKLG